MTGDSCGGNISLGWSQVQGASGYRIYRSDSPTGVFTQIATSTSYSYYTGYYPFTDSSLSGGTTYYYKIDAYPSGGGSSTPSSVVSAVSSDICPATFDCYPSSDYVSAGDPVTWTAVVTGGTGGPYTYNWGDNNNSLYDNHTDSLDTSYSYYGYQPMSLQVIDANGNPIPVDGSYDTSNPWKQCSGYVYVSPPSLSFNCSPDQSSVGIGIPVTWSVSNIVGGSGNYYYDWYDPSNSSEYYDTSATESYSSAGSQGMYLSLYDYDTGSYSNWVQCSPNVDVAPDCTDPDGTSKTYYSAPMSTNCDLISETRTCNNGALDGDSNFNYSSCSNTTVPATIKDFKLNQNTINKGSSCQLTWDLNNANENTTCSLYRNSTNSLISDYTPAYSSGSYTDNGITNETTYKLICGELDENGVLTSTDTKYATCYINPTSKEHS